MSHDGLVPKIFSEVHQYKTPYKANMLFFVFPLCSPACSAESIVSAR